METRDIIREQFKTLLQNSTYEKVTVSDICIAAHISRKTFYEYFHGKEDVVRDIFYKDAVEPLQFLHKTLGYLSPEELMKTECVHLYYAIEKEKDYYLRLIGEGLGDSGGVFVRSVTSAIYDYNTEVFERMYPGSMASKDWRFDYVAYFFASSQAMFMKKWIQEGMIVPSADLGELYIKITSDFWLSIAKDNL